MRQWTWNLSFAGVILVWQICSLLWASVNDQYSSWTASVVMVWDWRGICWPPVEVYRSRPLC